MERHVARLARLWGPHCMRRRQFAAGQSSHAGLSDQGDVSRHVGGGFDGWAGGRAGAAAQCLERPPPACGLPWGLRLRDARRHHSKKARNEEPHEGFEGGFRGKRAAPELEVQRSEIFAAAPVMNSQKNS